MGKHQLARKYGVICITASLSMLQACSGIGGVSGDMTLNVTSEPSGAGIYVMGKAVAETPAEISQQQLYPAGYDAKDQQLYGTLVIRKTGCQDFKKRIGYQDFNSDLSVKLNCSESAAGPSKQTATPNDPVTSVKDSDTELNLESQTQPIPAQQDMTETHMIDARKPTLEHSIKQRLIRIDSLRQEGLITEEEYQQARERILDAL
ncbi:MAG: hypothetical protein ABW092_18880 [Candidatus Thiodiazotropha sp.]